MDSNLQNFIQANSPDGGFLQSVCWRKFQESYRRKTYNIEIRDDKEPTAYANIITHILPAVGKYFYVPRGPIIKVQSSKFPPKADQPLAEKVKSFLNDLIALAKENNIGWVRVEPNSEEESSLIKENLPQNIKIKKSAVDMQPREIFILDISKKEEEILARMKQKTRYNIRLAEKRGVHITCLPAGEAGNTKHVTQDNVKDFLKLVKITAKRDGITAHPEEYYRKMFETIPSDILKLYIAEYEGRIIAANLVLFFGKTATYMHGASASEYRDAMAPYLLQWRQIIDAKKAGCERYDFGGIKTGAVENSWSGITKFKTGFAPDTKPIQFPGCYDIILKPAKYNLYRAMQKEKRIF